MAQDTSVMAAALRRFEEEKSRRRRELERRTAEIYRRVPRLESIDRELGSTAAKLVIAAFDEDGESAMRELERRNLALQREREVLLLGAGYSAHELDETPACPLCRDSGFSRDGKPCRCLMAFYTREQNRRLSKLLDLGSQSFDTFSLDWYSDQPWPGYRRTPLENMEMVLEICSNYAHSFGKCGGNLLFSGAPGLGKTFLSACIAREVSSQGYSVVYDTAGHVIQQFENGKFGRENPYEEDPDWEIDRYLNCDLLIVDDLGTEMLTSFVQSVVYRLVNDRLINRKSTVLSTNLTVEKLGERYGEAVRSRIEGEYQVQRFYGDDIRKLKRDQ